MTNLLLNEAKLVDYKTIRVLMTGAEQFEHKEDRAFTVAKYAITIDQAAPVSRPSSSLELRQTNQKFSQLTSIDPI